MWRPVLVALFLTLPILGALPSAAAATPLDVRDADVFNQEGQPLTRVPVARTVNLVATVVNTASTNFTGVLDVIFVVQRDGAGTVMNQTVTTQLDLGPGKRANITLPWTASQVGAHTLEVWIRDERGTTFTLHFVTAESQVLRGPLPERMLAYGWVYAGFLGAMVLFVAVARTRRTR
jgi:hypothetical protein